MGTNRVPSGDSGTNNLLVYYLTDVPLVPSTGKVYEPVTPLPSPGYPVIEQLGTGLRERKGIRTPNPYNKLEPGTPEG